jgi:hypothetical protein
MSLPIPSSTSTGGYTDPFELEITTKTAGATIRYTLNGSDPTETHGTIYTGPISITGTIVVRALAYKTDFEPTDIDTQTYIEASLEESVGKIWLG